MVNISISIVLYEPNKVLFEDLLFSLKIAINIARECAVLNQVQLYIIDNTSPHKITDLHPSLIKYYQTPQNTFKLQRNSKNSGYGLAHNLAIFQSTMDYHLILNPDIILHKAALQEAILFMQTHPNIIYLTPNARDQWKNKQYLCKIYPTLFDLFLRGFASDRIKTYYSQRLASYEMRGKTEDRIRENILIASGCFMFFRCHKLQKLGAFSARYFLYFEDFDLSLRCHSAIAYVPQVKITHYGGHSAKKGIKHIFFFIRSAWIFFHCYGWRW
jgi:GT2 family glycosyltransferase